MNNDDQHNNLFDDPLRVLFPLYELAIFVAMIPSGSILPYYRSELGYRLMRPWIYWLIFMFLVFSSVSGMRLGAAGSFPMFCFALGMGALAFYHRKMGWALIFWRPEGLHTMSRGNSHLQQLLGRLPAITIPMPAGLPKHPLLKPSYQLSPIPELLTQRYIEPFLTIAAGLWMLWVWHWVVFGLWVFVSGVCLALIEALILEKAINALLDMLDRRSEGKLMAAMDKMIADKQKGGTTDSKAKVAGLAVGCPELLQLRERRLQEEGGDWKRAA